MQLSEIIIQKIQKNGPISFRDFMEMALYYPGMGYYTSEKEKMGKQGDYYTSPVLSSLYGQMIGKQLEEMWCIMDKDPISIVEYGAGTGALCYDILLYLKKNAPLYQQLKYFIIEKSKVMKQKEQKLLNEKVEWIEDINDLTGITGCILSNEVVDNFSVNLVIMKDELMEVFVDYKNEFVEVLRPAPEELKNYLNEQDISLPEGYRTEINLQALEWIKEIAFSLKRGFVITIDYGFPCKELYDAKRNLGTLACYHQHFVTDLPYCNIGRQDITAHVNFSALNFWGKKYGLECTGFCNQNYFLRSLGLANYLRKIEMESSHNNKEFFFQINKLLIEMGNKFKVLIQQKGIRSKALTGMQFSQQLV
jgi:SAM-dependent MidA family methyltransferase